MASRFYFSSTAVPSVTPSFSAFTRQTELGRREMHTVKDNSAVTSVTMWANGSAAANESAGIRQFVSRPLAAGIAFATTDTIKCQVLCQESATNDNINRTPIALTVWSADGNTLRATLKALGHYGVSTAEWLNTGPRNRRVADGDTLDANYTTVEGDRLVLEIGGQVDATGGATVTGTQWFGAPTGSTDLGENETDTSTALVSWFEISRTVTFSSALVGTHPVTFGHAAPITGTGVLAATGAIVLGHAADLTGTGGGGETAAALLTEEGIPIFRIASTNGLDAEGLPVFNLEAEAAALVGTAAVTFAHAAALSSTSAITGIAAVTFAHTAAATGTTTLTGTAAVVFTHAAALGGGFAVSGTAAITFAHTAAMTGAAPRTGTAAVVFGHAAAMTGTTALAGTCAITFAHAAAITGRSTLTGTAANIFGHAAPILGRGTLAGTAAAVFTPIGAPTLPSGFIAGTAAITITPTATISATISRAGTAAVTFAHTAVLGATVSRAGTAAVVFAHTAQLAGTTTLAGTSAILFTNTGAMALGGITATTSFAFTSQGALFAAGGLAAVCDVEFTNSAHLVDLAVPTDATWATVSDESVGVELLINRGIGRASIRDGRPRL